MALSRLIVFVLAAAALAGCCASGSGCPASLPPDLATSDGLTVGPDDGMQPAEPSMGQTGRSKTSMMTESGMEPRRGSKSNPKRSFAEQDAADQEADAELTRHLKICSGCGPSGRDDMATSGDSTGGGRAAGTARPKTREMSNTAE